MYDWPKIIVADAKDGMEYPMITLDGGTYPSHQGLLAHEVGHMWFYGMLGSNETYRAFLDEGFTQFLTVWSMDKIVGPKRARGIGKKGYDKHLDSSWTRFESLYSPYLNHVNTSYDEPLNTHSSGFHGAIRHGGNYGLVYYKTGTMLYNLRYVLGDTLFLNAMKHYVKKWKFSHPYPEDFRDAITEFTQTDLNWFFDQWLETTKYIDYSINDVKKLNRKDFKNGPKRDPAFNLYKITFERKGGMTMPIDFTVRTDKGKSLKYRIPNTWYTKKDTGVIVLDKWYGWDLLRPTYETLIPVSKDDKITSVEIDPLYYLADADLTNNKKGKGGIRKWEFDHRVSNNSSWTVYKNFYRPDLWYNHYDGIQIGAHIEGKYLSKSSYSATGWFNTRLLQYRKEGESSKGNQPLAFKVYNENSTNKLWPQSKVYEHAYYNAGIWKGELGFEKVFRKQDQRNQRYSKAFIKTKYLINDLSFREYLLYPEQWGPVSPNTSDQNYVNGNFDIGYFRNYIYTGGSGNFTITLRTPSIGSDYNYGYLNLNSINSFALKKFEIKSRVFGQLGVGDFPLESSLYLAGANPESLIDNKFTYARAFIPTSWTGFGADINHFHMGGGLNLRGYSGYYAAERVSINKNDTIVLNYLGQSGLSLNVEVDFDKYIKIPAKGITKNLKLDTYFFSDAGILSNSFNGESFLGKIRVDAGIGTSLTIKFSPRDIKPLVVRFDMPLFLNRPPAVSDYFEFRYVVGINRAF
jgi:aminopeptidase N